LNGIRILELVDKDVRELLLHESPDVVVFSQKIPAADK